MKCSVCDGRGYFPLSNIAVKICTQCNGTGEIEITNDEWRKTCSAEEFAEFLCNVGFENETIVRRFKPEWVKWLKEKHDGSM